MTHQDKKVSLISRYTSGEHLRVRIPQLEDQDLLVLQEYLMSLARRNCVPATLSGVISAFAAFVPTIRDGRLLTVTRRQIEAFIERQQDQGLKPISINRQLSGLSGFYRSLCEDERLGRNPVFRRHYLQVPEPLPRAMSQPEIERFLRVIDWPRDRAIFLLLLRSGIRIGELVALTVDHLRLIEQELIIPKGGKNRRGRVVYFWRDARQALEFYLQRRPPVLTRLIFLNSGHQPLTVRTIQRRFKHSIQKAGLNPEYTPHCLRHTFASDLLNAGADLVTIQHLLGHDTVTLTQRYARLSDQRKRQVYEQAMARIEDRAQQEVSYVA